MISSQRYAVAEESQVGEARRQIQQSGSETFCGKAAIIATELGRNLVRHAGGGEIIVREIRLDGQNGLEILALDRGPGLKNLTECLRDGYSTIGTAGTGMGSVKRLADRFDVFTEVGKGTCIWVQIFDGLMPPKVPSYQVSGVSVALEGETMCGDAWEVIERTDGTLRVLVMDGLGHGPFAAEAALEAVMIFRAQSRAGVGETMDVVHGALMKTRGAAGALVELAPVQEQIKVSAIGNISMRVISGEVPKSLICDNGTLGVNARKAREYAQPFPMGALLVMHSDGLTANWTLNDYPGLSHRSPGLIAGVLYRDYTRGRDDATVVAVRYRP